LHTLYSRIILRYPRLVLLGMAVLLGALGYQATKLEIDASAESLLLENDEDLRFFREVNRRYAVSDFLIVTFSPTEDLLADSTLDTLRHLSAELERIEGVESVVSLLNVPLLQSPPRPVKELLRDVPTLDSRGVDKALAREEFLHSPIYRNLIVSPDFRTTGMQVNLVPDKVWQDFVTRRYDLREKQRAGTLTAQDAAELERIGVEFKAHRDRVRESLHRTIAAVRTTLDRYRDRGELFLGGAEMIGDDLITFVQGDLRVFGTAVLGILLVMLWTIFRQIRWLLLPLVTCGLSVLATAGMLGLFDWEVTVISSNFVSLQLILTLAITIHLIVRYREEVSKHPQASQHDLVLNTMLAMGKPCLYMALTTIAGFASLLISNILPVINFGWIMASGVAISLVLTFVLFPALLVQFPRLEPNKRFEARLGVTRWAAFITERYGRSVIAASLALLVFCAWGSSRLVVENSFIDYFRPSTEIYQGMRVIDEQLGGTTPLDIVLRLPQAEAAPADAAPPDSGGGELAEFEQEFEAAKGEAQYWFTAARMAEVERLHDYLDSVPEIGKVLSLGTLLKVGRSLNDGAPLDNFQLALLYNELPERFRRIILSPYVSVEDSEVRYFVRVRDSDPSLRRNELIHRIQRDLGGRLELEPEQYRLTGLLVLYNNMLQSLFTSQIETLGLVIAALAVMFLILFRSLRLALIAIAPNILSVGTVLGLMGWVGIPLDMMTITIASISVGIAVDDTIHYIHRFRAEFEVDGDYIGAMHRSHGSIGYAMFYTSVTIVVGFSILVLSNFIPSIYFGLLTGLAMVIANIAALILLPRLLLLVKPLGPAAEPAA
jgi:hypothetical protein